MCGLRVPSNPWTCDLTGDSPCFASLTSELLNRETAGVSLILFRLGTLECRLITYFAGLAVLLPHSASMVTLKLADSLQSFPPFSHAPYFSLALLMGLKAVLYSIL